MTPHVSTLVLEDADDIHALYDSLSGMRPVYTQLSGGKSGHVFDILELEGVSVVKARSAGKARWLDAKAGGALHFGWCCHSEREFRACGIDIDKGHGMVWLPDREMEYVTLGATLTFEVCVSSRLVEMLGWKPHGDPLAAVGEKTLEDLSLACFKLFELSRTPFEEGNWLVLRDNLLDRVEAALWPWLASAQETRCDADAAAYYGTIRLADEFLRAFDHSRPLTVDRLACELGVSRRGLHYAFRRHLDMTPRRYLEVLRLHQLRQQLRAASPDDTTVAQAARNARFTDLGRLPGIYRQLFGENPGDTLKRRG